MLEELKSLFERYNTLRAEADQLDAEYAALSAPRSGSARGREIKQRLFDLCNYGMTGEIDLIQQEITNIVIAHQDAIISALENSR